VTVLVQYVTAYLQNMQHKITCRLRKESIQNYTLQYKHYIQNAHS